MKKTRIDDQFTDYGYGFPVVLQNVPMVHMRGVWTPDVNYNELHKKVLRTLARSGTQLTGNNIKFMRNFFELTYSELGAHFRVSAHVVIQWENYGDNRVGVTMSFERDMRLFIMDRLGESSEFIGELYRFLCANPPMSHGDRYVFVDMAS